MAHRIHCLPVGHFTAIYSHFGMRLAIFECYRSVCLIRLLLLPKTPFTTITCHPFSLVFCSHLLLMSNVEILPEARSCFQKGCKRHIGLQRRKHTPNTENVLKIEHKSYRNAICRQNKFAIIYHRLLVTLQHDSFAGFLTIFLRLVRGKRPHRSINGTKLQTIFVGE